MIRYFSHPRPAIRACEIALWILLGLACGLRWASADDGVTATMARVERALIDAGFNEAAGYSQLPPPAVELVDEIPGPRGELWGSYSVATGRIAISRRAPEGCRRLILAHEVSHDLVARKSLHLSVKVEEVVAFMEKVSRIAEEAADADAFAPNCLKVRGAL